MKGWKDLDARMGIGRTGSRECGSPAGRWATHLISNNWSDLHGSSGVPLVQGGAGIKVEGEHVIFLSLCKKMSVSLPLCLTMSG